MSTESTTVSRESEPREMFQLVSLSIEEMLSDSGREYNPQIWVKQVMSYTTSEFEDIQFYKVPKGTGTIAYDYDRHYMTYKRKGLLTFREFSAYSATLHSGGYTRARIIDGSLMKIPFLVEGTKESFYAKPDQATVDYFKKYCTPIGIYATRDI